MWRAGFGLVVAVGCASCLDVPRHRTTDAGPGNGDAGPDGPRGELEGLTLSGDPLNTEFFVSAPEWEVRFPGPSIPGIIRVPDQIRIGSADVLGHHGNCNGEDGVGLAIYPALTLSGRLDNDANTTTVDFLSGPAMVQVTVMWMVSYDCAGGVSAGGTTGFTFYPDGRIVRFDSISPTDTELTSSACGCGSGGGQFYLTSLLTLANGEFTRLLWHDVFGDQNQVVPPPDLDWIDDGNPTWACLDDSDGSSQTHAVGIVWRTPAGTDDNATRIKPDIAADPTGNIVLLWDWLHSEAVLPATSFDTSAVWYLLSGAAARCDHVTFNALENAFTEPPQLTVDDGQTPINLDIDPNTGLYFYDPAVPPNPLPTTYTLRPVQPIRPGFAVSVLFGSGAEPIIRRNGAALTKDVDYLVNPAVDLSGGTWRHWIWFRDNFAVGATITVQAP